MDPRTYIVKRHNWRMALEMLCIKLKKSSEYAWYFNRHDPDLCRDGKRLEWIRKMTRLLSLNYNGIHNGENPAFSPRLLPETCPNAEPIRYPQDWKD